MTTKIKSLIHLIPQRRGLFACIAAAAFVAGTGFPALAQDAAPLAPSAPAPSEQNQLSHLDKRFILKAGEASANEVALSELAADRASNPDVKSFAQKMLTDHRQLNDELSALASHKNIDIAKSVKKGGEEGVESLSKKSGKDFDEAYMKGMVGGHEEAADLFQKEAADGKDADTVALATKYLATIMEHLQHAKMIAKTID